MTKKEAIKLARQNVGTVYKFGDGYRFASYDSKLGAWRESTPCPYWAAVASRHAALVFEATMLLHDDAEAALDAQHDFETNGLAWTSFVPKGN